MPNVSSILRTLNAVQLDNLTKLFVAYHQFYKQTTDFAVARQYLQTRFSQQESFCLLADDEKNPDEVKGFAHLYAIRKPLHGVTHWILYDLFVAETARNQGIADALLSAVQQQAKNQGVTTVRLTTAHDNKTAQRRYVAQGYQLDTNNNYYTLSLTPDQLRAGTAEPNQLQAQLIQLNDLVHYHNLLSQQFPNYDVEMLKSELLNQRGALIMVKEAENVLAIAQLSYSFCSLLMNKIALIQDVWFAMPDQAIAQALIQAVVQLAATQCQEISIITSPQDSLLNSTLEQYGFKTYPQWQQYVLPLSQPAKQIAAGLGDNSQAFFTKASSEEKSLTDQPLAQFQLNC